MQRRSFAVTLRHFEALGSLCNPCTPTSSKHAHPSPPLAPRTSSHTPLLGSGAVTHLCLCQPFLTSGLRGSHRPGLGFILGLGSCPCPSVPRLYLSVSLSLASLALSLARIARAQPLEPPSTFRLFRFKLSHSSGLRLAGAEVSRHHCNEHKGVWGIALA